MTTALQRVYVTTHPEASFLVYAIARDEFICETVARLYGRQESGAAHEWVAVEVDEKAGEVAAVV